MLVLDIPSDAASCTKSLFCPKKHAPYASGHSLGARNGRKIGKMCAIAASGAGVPKRALPLKDDD
jgi:hypothetical protein